MELQFRLDILKSSGQITEEIYSKLLKVINLFKEKKKIELTEENGAMFITHLSSALKRIESNDIVNKMDESILEEIKKDSKYNETLETIQEIEKVTGKFPEEEKDFIEMHICTLLNK